VSPDINQTEISQVTIFIFEYALAQLLMAWGIKPQALIGYSFGEYTAACVSGVFSLKDGLKLVVSRGQLLQETPPGAMLSVPLPCREITPLLNLNPGLSLSIDNGPSCVVSGPHALIDTFEKQMKEKRVVCMRVPAERAIHSRMMEPAAEKLSRFISTIPLNKPNIPYVSNVTGEWQSDKEVVSPEYWARHLRETVQFDKGMKTLLKKPGTLLIELGPGRDISTLALRHLENSNDAQSRVLNLVRPPHQDISDVYFLLNRLGRLWLLGQPIDWFAFHGEEKKQRRRISLPTYPFERQEYRIENEEISLGTKLPGEISLSKRKKDMADWFYIPSWKRFPIPAHQRGKMAANSCWLVFIDECGLGTQLAKQLEQEAQVVVIVKTGKTFQKVNHKQFTINPREESHYHNLFEELLRRELAPDAIVHLWCVTSDQQNNSGSSELTMPGAAALDTENAVNIQYPGYYSLLNIARSLGKSGTRKDIQLSVVTNNMQEVTGGDGLYPGKATVLGPVKVIPGEYGNIKCQSIDVDLPVIIPGRVNSREKKLIKQLRDELMSGCNEAVTAYRGDYRWVQTIEPMRLEASKPGIPQVKKGGVYLITGGLGGIGLVLAKHLAKKNYTQLVLIGRTILPPRHQWESFLEKSGNDENLAKKIREIKTLEQEGVKVLVFSADVSQPEQMQRVITRAEEKLGPIDGIIHCAGLADGEMIQRRTAEISTNIFKPKLEGTLVLDAIFNNRKEKPGLFILCSSITSILPAIGQVGYCAANAFLDAFAHYRNALDAGKDNHINKLLTISINWDRWKGIGIANIVEKKHKELTGEEMPGGITPAEGTQLFDRILEDNQPQVAVSSRDIKILPQQNQQPEISPYMDGLEKKTAKRLKPRPQLDSDYVPPRNQMEHSLVNMWSEFFGIESVGTRDDFFEMGGDSLKALILLPRIQKQLNVEISIAEFFNRPSIQNLLEYIKGADKSTFFSIEPTEKREYYALSSAQRRLYFLQQMESKNTGYNIQEAVALEGTVNIVHLEDAFRKLIQRHESLRSSFEVVNHEPVLRIHDDVPFKIESYGSMESPVRHFVRPFDLKQAPLLRVGLFTRETDQYILMADMHHIISDGISHAILIQEFLALYSGQILPEIYLQYKDYSQWQNSKSYKETMKKQEIFWLEEFEEQGPVLILPTDFPRPPVLSFEGSFFRFEIGAQETRALNQLAQAEKTTLFMVLLAACNVLLSRLSHQEDIVMGTPAAGRNYVGLEKIIGMFVNTLVLRNSPRGDWSFKRFLADVKKRTLKAFDNQDYPFEDLVEKVVATRDTSRNPLFDIMIVLQNLAIDTDGPQAVLSAAPGIQDLKIKPYEHEIITSPLDMTITADEGIDKIALSVEYCTKLFKENTIQRIFGYLKKIISAVTTDPDQTISTIDILSEEEKQQLIYGFNDTTAGYPENKTIRQLFEEQVRKTPEHTAVRAALDFRYIYEELNSETINPHMLPPLETCCFKKNKYIFACHLEQFDENNPFILLKSHQHNIAVVNRNVSLLLELFDGKRNLASIYRLLRQGKVRLAFLVYAVNIDDVLEISFSFKKKEEFLLEDNFEELIRLVKSLHRIHFIQLENLNPHTLDTGKFGIETPFDRYFEPVKPGVANPAEAIENKHVLEDLTGPKKNLSEADVLLLGDTPGQSSAGLLYLASYLRRNGIKAYCHFNDSNWQSALLEKNIEALLMKIKPRIVGVSMKWFLHIARVQEICRIIKEYSKRNSLDIKVVLGGNSASFFRERIIRDENVDYIIRGDGEIPFLKLCRGETPIPNLVYKQDGEIIENPITYIQTPENSSDIYLSHMDEIMISDYSCLFGIFFIFTQKGCKKNCHYCGGCNDAQRITFNRPGLFRRNVSEVRRDIIETKKYSSTIYFLFDDYSNDSLLEYCKQVWQGIDLSKHFGFLSNVIPPSPELIEYSSKVFKYVYWNLDMASMSERHRMQLYSESMVKYQPTDKEMLEMFDECEKYENNELIINIITGLPYFNREDIKASKEILKYIINRYSCFGEFFWARLHAEPGAPVLKNVHKYNMYTLASTFEKFLQFSNRNFREFEWYPNVDNFIYPYIYFQDEDMNSAVSQYYAETHQQWSQYKINKWKKQVVTDDLSYSRLNEKADRLAEIAKKKGVQTDTIVGIMVERSLDMIVGLLGILKAGGAYLPLDPEYPQTRIAYMMQDCQANLLLSQGHLLDRIPFKNDEYEIIDLGTMDVTSNSPPAPGAVKPVEKNREKNSLAYIIFTSGSTGKPKGVAIEHRSIVNTLVWRKNHYRFDENDIVLQLPSFSFDSSVEDIFTPLISGSQLLMVQAHQRFDVDYIRELLRTIAVTHFLNVPVLYKTYLDEIPEALGGLKHITIAGENFAQDLVDRHFQHLPQVRMYNEYGPTENSVCSTAYQFGPERTWISIGKPISNVRCYILDSSGELCPIGTSGELCLAGAGISRGYVNNPELTAEKFRRAVIRHSSFVISSSSKLSTNDRFYRTGDLARWLPDGNIEFQGRIDNQVKIRGYRVETGEIASRLLKHEAVDDAVVMVREYDGGEKYLAAYIVTAARSTKLASELSEYLSTVLPEYMVPSHFISIDRIPLTPGGKIDIHALPAPGTGPSLIYTAPGNEIERKLVKIWTEILPGSAESGDSTIGIDDNFFMLGGHSLKATAMVSRIHKIFDVKVPMMEIFNWPTVRGLSGYIKKAVGDRFISIEPAEKKSHYVLSTAQRRLYSFQQMNKTSIAYNSPNAYVLEEEVDKDKLELVFRKLIQRHDSFRTSFHPEQNFPGYVVQRVHHRVEFAAAHHEVETKEAIEEIIKHFARPFDLSRAPLLRVGLIKAEGGQQVLVYDMHHIITDGTSMEILIRDFMALYTGKELPGLRLQYKDYAQWQNSPARQEAIKKQEDFWLRSFAGGKPVLDLPTDHARPERQTYEGNNFHFALDPKESQQLKVLAAENETTLFIVLLGMFSVLISKLSGQEDIVIGTGSEGRRHEDLRRIIGMFVNTLALRSYPEKNKTFNGFLKELKESTLAAFENQDYPFEDLVEKVVPHRDASRNPLFDVVFQFQAAGDSQNQTRALKVKPYQMKVGISKFDLTLWGFEIGETLFFNFEYCTRLFEEETIIKMAEYFKRIIAALPENPGKQLIDIEMFTEEEQEGELVQLTDDFELDEME
jgi:amino acid adenylation domain-containing protein